MSFFISPRDTTDRQFCSTELTVCVTTFHPLPSPAPGSPCCPSSSPVSIPNPSFLAPKQMARGVRGTEMIRARPQPPAVGALNRAPGHPADKRQPLPPPLRPVSQSSCALTRRSRVQPPSRGRRSPRAHPSLTSGTHGGTSAGTRQSCRGSSDPSSNQSPPRAAR